ncbi:MAG: AEC family transporter [Candidatus Omnitrophica bacterium]|nr:AEC family transporter [Candidatus Omnitrophota bacterium]
MFLEYFKISLGAVLQIFILGLAGFILVKRAILGHAALDILSRLVVEVTLPALIFTQLIKDFSFSLYPDWWLFPFLSVLITLLGLSVGYIFATFIKGPHHKVQFLSLIAFQNSGYLPLAIISVILSADKVTTALTYLFLFLLGFNLIIWSFGVYMLSFHESKKFEFASLFSPPVVAILVSLILVFFGLNKFIPELILKPLRMVGDCTLPLAMFVVGGSLTLIKLKHIDKKAIFFVILAKLIILPSLGLFLVIKFKLAELLGLLIVLQLAVPPATSLSVISRHYKKEDLLISQGIFVGHLIALITLPIFLSLYFALGMVK